MRHTLLGTGVGIALLAWLNVRGVEPGRLLDLALR
jgi:hypothetical protein